MAAGLIDRLFLAHPRSAGQGYFEHMRFAWSFAATMAVGTVAAPANPDRPEELTLQSLKATSK